MTDDQILIKDQIKSCYDIKGNLSFKKISKDLLIKIEENTNFLNDFSPTITERIYCIMNDIENIIRCSITGKKLRFSRQTKKYTNTKEFSYRNRIITNKPDVSKRLNDKNAEIISKYKTRDYSVLSKNDCILLYENICPHKNSRINGDIALKNIDLVCSLIHHTKFLGESFSDLSERYYCIKNDINEIQKDRNGNHLKFINRYKGYSKYADRNKMISNNIEDIEKKIKEEYIINYYIKDGNTTSRMNLTCMKCNHTFETFFKNGLWKNIYCAGCYGDPNRSKGELEIIDFLKNIGIKNIMENDKQILNGLEIDIYCPDEKIAIEYCGILWHSFGKNYPNNYHQESTNKHKHFEKYKRCKDLGIRLITIFDNEWNKKKDIVKSILNNIFNKNDIKIYARNCEYSIVDKHDAKQFLIDNHIQGDSKFTRAYGLYYNNELISLACFGKRKITRGEVKNELIRFCSKKRINVVGGASKIIKNSGEDNFISYCDVRYGSGNLYTVLGMDFIRHAKPNYYYTLDKTHLLHRSNFQKHKIFNGENKSERDIMYDRGYRRIYDCGNLVFEFKKSNIDTI